MGPKKPRCFKNVKHLPCKYQNNRNSGVHSRVLIQGWECKTGKFCLLITAQPTMPMNIKVILLPPLDQGIITQVKRDYNRQLVQYFLRQMDCGNNTSALKWNILQAMLRLCLAWSRLKPRSITNCFAKAGFPAGTDENDCNDETDDSKFDSGESSFSDFATVDNQLATCSPESDDTPVDNIQVNNGSGDEDDSDEVEIKCPMREEINCRLDVLERFFMTSTNFSPPGSAAKYGEGI
ncbi:hypothetical protein PR048_025240 [Dryococelus australis]|uniref:DDE-1 domain-containing protein n=1 Tax=Dryococelus australis TaxID=614101 RepID=A0ABQ9GQU4_9NEOP|nr:hypothetical protein PR048_025240 [Dryococelus australis]